MVSSGNVVWEHFDEQTKRAFVGDPLHSRFFFKTRVMANKNVKATARVSHQHTKSTSSSLLNAAGRNEAVKYVTSDMTNLSRLTQLLCFVMQEVLGAMKTLPAPTTALLSSPSQLAEISGPAGHGGNKKKHKKKKKAAKK